MKKFMIYDIYKRKLSFHKNSFFYIYRLLIYFYYLQWIDTDQNKRKS